MTWTSEQCAEAYVAILEILRKAGFDELAETVASDAALGEVATTTVPIARPSDVDDGQIDDRRASLENTAEEKKRGPRLKGKVAYVAEVSSCERLRRLVHSLGSALSGVVDAQVSAFESLQDERLPATRILWADPENGDEVYSVTREDLQRQRAAVAEVLSALNALKDEAAGG